MIEMVTTLLIIVAISAFAEADTAPTLKLRTKSAIFVVDSHGSLIEISRSGNGRNYLAQDQPAPLLSIRLAGTLHSPDSTTWDAKAKQLTLHYTSVGATVELKAISKPSHIVFEVLKAEPLSRIELVLWGPYPTTIGQIIGDTVGVVRDSEFAVGIQALNPKTIGGYPTNENDIEAEYSGDDHGIYPNLSPELLKDQHYRSDTAKPAAFGSTLQAFCRNRDKDRVVANWGHMKYFAPAFSDGGVVGSKIALFACPAAMALETIGRIEVAEGLPHPKLDGVWAKVASAATTSYLIVDFSEANVDQAIEMARRAGLKYLYNSSPFETWGHFKLKPDLFPHGWDGLRTCIEKARAADIRIGFHTLSNFITPNDAYVTPVPDPRLARVGASKLSANLDAQTTEIPIASPDYFATKSAMNTAVIDEELVRFGSITAQAPWRLLECKRGAWGTMAALHTQGSAVARLMDHDYNVFLTNADLSQEVARNIATLCNHTGARQLSFDGLEGNWSTGYGQYGRTLFTTAWYDALAPELRGQIINDASNPGHYNWHTYTRMNWGEPWYAGFRESQTLYRFKNQVYFERNLMPHMLGWFALRPETSLEDAEWLLARAAGYDAGFALAMSIASTAQLSADPSSADTARTFGAVPTIMEAVREWETARQSGTFPPAIKAALRDNAREFELKPAGKRRWNLFEIHSSRFEHDAGQAAPTERTIRNVDGPQPLQWILHAGKGPPVRDIHIELNGAIVLDLKGTSLPEGGCIKYSGGTEAVIADASWKEVSRIAVDAARLHIERGEQRITVLTARHSGTSLTIELRTAGAPIKIRAARMR